MCQHYYPPASQLWVQFAYFELRRKDVTAAKKLMGTAIGMCPKEKLFKAYIDLRTKVGRTLPRATYDQADPSPPPLQLYEFDDVRQIYMKYLEFDPSNTAAWIKWATLEAGLGDLDRARHLFDLASTQELDMPEVLWKVRAGSPPLLVLTVAVLADHHFFNTSRPGSTSSSRTASASGPVPSTRPSSPRLATSRSGSHMRSSRSNLSSRTTRTERRSRPSGRREILRLRGPSWREVTRI